MYLSLTSSKSSEIPLIFSGEASASVFQSSTLCPFMYALLHGWAASLQQLHSHLGFGRGEGVGMGWCQNISLSNFALCTIAL